MKAMVYHEYGSPESLELQEIDTPVPDETDVLLKVRAVSVNWLDWHFLTGTPVLVRLMADLLKPKNYVLGIDVAGRVEAVGAKVSEFKPGDEVFGSTAHGCFAEYVIVRPDELQFKPANLSFEAAAAAGAAAIIALRGLQELGQITPGQEVLINGASGGVGTFSVQIAGVLGATVTGVCSTHSQDLVRALGADRVIDYARQDFADDVERYDLIFDVAAKRTFSECRSALKPQGIYVTTAFSPVLVLQSQWISKTGSQKMAPVPPRPPSRKDLTMVRELLESGAVVPVIDRCYPLDELPQALQYLSKGHAQGKIVISV